MEAEYGDEDKYVAEYYQEKKPSIWSRIWAKITGKKPLQIESAEAKAKRNNNNNILSHSQTAYRQKRAEILNRIHENVEPIDLTTLNTGTDIKENEEVLEGRKGEEPGN